METRSALVCGATGNIGSVCAATLLETGWEVTKVARHLSKDIDEITALDLSIYDDVRRFAANCPQFDLVIMAQGTTQVMPMIDFHPLVWKDILNNSLYASAFLTACLFQEKCLKPYSLLVYCSSIHAEWPRAGRAAYAAAKGGLESFARAAAVDLAPFQIRTACLRLGQLTTPMQGIEFTPQQASLLQHRCLTPWTTPESVMQLILELYYQPSITGAVIDMNSGQGLNVWPREAS